MEKYCNISHLPPLPDYVIDEALNAQYDITFIPNVIQAKSKLFDQTDFMKNLRKAFPESEVKNTYLKNEPQSIYDWHIDYKRSCSINWVIKTNPRAVTMHKEFYDNDMLYHHRIWRGLQVLFWKAEEVHYEMYKPTVLRVDVPHAVINLAYEDRIILCVTVREASYEQLKEYMMGLNIKQY